MYIRSSNHPKVSPNLTIFSQVKEEDETQFPDILQVGSSSSNGVSLSEVARKVLGKTNKIDSLLWGFKTGSRVESSPCIGSDGTLYVGSSDGNLYSVDVNGKEKWIFRAGTAIESSPCIGSDGTLYVGGWNGNLYAVDTNGKEKWIFEVGSRISSSPCIGSDGTVYVGSYDGNLYAITPDGQARWQVQTGDRVYSSPCIGSDGTIYVGSDDNNLYAVKPNFNEENTHIPGNIDVTPPELDPVW